MADRVNYNSMQRKATLTNADSNVRQADALERIAAALEALLDHMYPAPAESVIVTSMGEPAAMPMEANDESGTTSEV